MATKEQVSQFQGIDGDQDAGFELLPVGEEKDAPADSLYTFQFDEEETQVKHSGDSSKHPGLAFVNWRAVVIEPEIHEGRSQFGMFYAPVEPEDTSDAKAARDFKNAQKRFVGAVDAVLGPGTAASLPNDREAMMEALCEQLKGEVFVGKLRRQAGSNGFRDKNEVATYFPADYVLQEED